MIRCLNCRHKELPTDCKACKGLGILDAPRVIYLQTTDLQLVTWCDDQINDSDIEYVLKKKV